jgi:arylsulfatase A-like enzyme
VKEDWLLAVCSQERGKQASSCFLVSLVCVHNMMTLLQHLLFVIMAAPPREPLDKPNVVMLFVDDLGYGDTGFNGHPTTLTPNIDALAYGGKVLSTWYSACPVCSASRASLLTGRQWPRMGIPGVFSPTTNSGLPLNETTLAQQLQKAGYISGIVGKWQCVSRSRSLDL